MIRDSLLKLPASFSILVKSIQELLFLSCRSILLNSPDFSLTAVYEQPSTVPGFASSLKDIPNSRLIWEGWNNDTSAISCLYKCRQKPGKIFILNIINMDPHVTLISFSEKSSSESSSLNLDPTIFINEDYLSQQTMPIEFKGGSSSRKELIDSLFLEQDNLQLKIRDLVSKVIKPFKSVSSNNDASCSSSISENYQPYIPQASNPNNIGINEIVPPQRIPAVGDGDLNPFPLFIPSIPQPSHGTGSLVGPNHPIFGDDPMGLGPQGPYLPGLPQPRFDPFYPTIPGEIGPGGRGRGRMRPQGEPNPDHLRPPSFNGNDFI